jgi:hypothetical protein
MPSKQCQTTSKTYLQKNGIVCIHDWQINDMTYLTILAVVARRARFERSGVLFFFFFFWYEIEVVEAGSIINAPRRNFLAVPLQEGMMEQLFRCRKPDVKSDKGRKNDSELGTTATFFYCVAWEPDCDGGV